MGCTQCKNAPIRDSAPPLSPSENVKVSRACSSGTPHSEEPSCQKDPKKPSCVSPDVTRRATNDDITLLSPYTTAGPSPVATEETISSPLIRSGPPSSTDTPQRTSTGLDPGVFIQSMKSIHLKDKYKCQKKLGSGACGDVMLCYERETGAERAIKMIKKSNVSSSNEFILREVSVLKQLDHPNIVKLFAFFDDNDNYYLVTEACKGGELFDEIVHRQRFTEADAARTLQQIISGVNYLHQHRIVHRDLKPENILLETRERDTLVKIVDFGLSSFFDPNVKLIDRLGTPYYIAPEVLKEKYDEKCDVWSCGVILYILLCGYPPFVGHTDKQILHHISLGKYYFDPLYWRSVSNEAKDLVAKMLTFDPSKRISAELCLQHPWLRRFTARPLLDTAANCPSLFYALNNMRKFHASQQLAQAAFLFMGSKLTTVEETKELTRIFRELDTNGDGALDREELIQGYYTLQSCRGQTSNVVYSSEEIEQEVDRILESVDFDRNGVVNYSEFVTVAMDRRQLLSKARLEAAFKMFDQDGSGKIACHELREILTHIDEAQWDLIIQDVDLNHDGEVDFEEFVVMMSRIIDEDRPPIHSPRH